MYNPYIVGKQIYLRHPTEDDARGKWHEWFSNEEITKFMPDRFWPNSKDAQLEFYKSLINNREKLVLSVVNKTNNEHVGIVGLSFINWVHHYADISIVIGENEYRKGPVATEAFALMLKVAFLRLNLLNVKSSYYSSNKNSEAIHRLFKFKKVGTFKDLMFIDGHSDSFVVEVLDKESWLKRNG